jgi:hypothetical protein
MGACLGASAFRRLVRYRNQPTHCQPGQANGSRQKVYEVFAIRLGDGENNETNRQLSGFIRVCKGRSPSYEPLAFNSYQIDLGRRE